MGLPVPRPVLLTGIETPAARGAHAAPRTGRLRTAWSRFWAAAPAHRVYLIVGSVFYVASLASDLGMLGDPGDEFRGLDRLATLFATGAFLAQWWRTTVGFALLTAPMALTLLGASEIHVVTCLPVLLASVLATARSRWFVAAAVGLALAWSVGQPATPNGETRAIWFLLLLLALGVGVGVYLRSAIQQRESDRRAIEDAERRAADAAERERRILARDLHDIVAHNLTIISMQSRTAQYLGTPEAAQSVLKVVGDSAKDALVDLRRMLAILQQEGVVEPVAGPGSADAGSAATVAHLSSGAERMAEELRLLGMEATHHVDLGPDEINLGVRAALYRVMQEAVTNVVKHAGPGEECSIRASLVDADVVLEVENSLPPAAPRMDGNSSGVGLRSMRDRVEAFGGRLTVGPSAEGRWLVRATVPRPVMSPGVESALAAGPADGGLGM